MAGDYQFCDGVDITSKISLAAVLENVQVIYIIHPIYYGTAAFTQILMEVCTCAIFNICIKETIFLNIDCNHFM